MTICLDQNHWIDITTVQNSPSISDETEILQSLAFCAAVSHGEMSKFPLSLLTSEHQVEALFQPASSLLATEPSLGIQPSAAIGDLYVILTYETRS